MGVQQRGGEGGPRVLVDARVRPGEQGGVQQTIMGLAAGLSGLHGPEQYYFLVDGQGEWLRPFLGEACTVIQAAFPSPATRRAIEAGERLVSGAGAAIRYLSETGGRRLPRADRVLAGRQVDVVHFMRHRGWRTQLPNLYVPHDLQHVDLPHLFSPQTRAYRSWVYGAMAAQATKLVALTHHQASQLSAHFSRSLNDVAVVPWASVLPLYKQSHSEREPTLPHEVPNRFAFYPAHSWPHKNHATLIAALGKLRRQGIDIPLVMTGGGDLQGIRAAGENNGVSDLLTHLGYVQPATIRMLYEESQLLIFPSIYEGFGLPVVEAMSSGTPVVSADIAPLNALVGDAARMCNPRDASDLATTIASVWADRELRRTMSERGKARTTALTWHKTALRYRALYRQLLARETKEDQVLLAGRPPV